MRANARARQNGGEARRVSRWPWFLVGLLAGAGGVTLAWTLRSTDMRPARPLSTHGRTEAPRPPPGATMWAGELERVRIHLNPPADFIRPESCLTTVEPWVLPGYRREDVTQILRDNLVPLEVQSALLAATECTSGEGCVVRPPADAVLALEPVTRLVLYRLLGRLPGNETKRAPFRFRASEWATLSGQGGLSSSTVDLVRRLTVTEGDWVLFWDSGALCQRMNDEDKVKFIRVATRAESYLVKLVLRSDTDTEPILRYWADRPRQKSLRTLFESAKSSGKRIVRLDIVHLLSPFLRALAYTYPLPGDPPYDCHWTTFNFFEVPPNDRFLEPRVVREEFPRRFDPIPRESARYGDVVAMMDPTGVINHTAIFLAEDLVFSKNGNGLYSPWAVTTLDFLMRLYGEVPGTYPAFFRRHEMGTGTPR